MLGKVEVVRNRDKEAEALAGNDSSDSNENFKRRFKREQRMVGIAKTNLCKAQEAADKFDEIRMERNKNLTNL